MPRPRASYPTKAVIERAFKAARDLGLDPAGFEVSPNGTVRVLLGGARQGDEADTWADLR